MSGVAREGKVLGVISIKGGVGKTTVVSNLGAVLANRFNRKVLLVDGNMSAPNLALHLGITDPDKTLHDVIYDHAHAGDAVIRSGFGFDVLPSALAPGKGHQKRINPYKLHNRLLRLRSDYDFIVIDSSPNLNDEMLSAMIASDELVVVTSPDYPTLSCTMHAVKVAKERKTPIRGLVLNKVRNRKFELSVKEIEDATGVPVLSVIDDDVRVLEALSKAAPASLAAPGKGFSVAYCSLAASLAGEEYKDPRIGARIKGLFRR